MDASSYLSYNETVDSNTKILGQADEERRQAEEKARQAEERTIALTQNTSLLEYLRTCHNLFSRPLRVTAPSCPAKQKILNAQGKLCPSRLLPWTECPATQAEIYNSVCSYFHAASEHPLELFPAVLQLKSITGLQQGLSCETDLQVYESLAVHNHVRRIISELFRVPEARRLFCLGSDVFFENHSNSLESDVAWDDNSTDNEEESSGYFQPLRDQFCIHRNDSNRSLLMTWMYKPPHKLSVENLRAGLQPRMDFWNSMAQRRVIPSDKAERLRYNAERMVGSVLTEAYHVMLWEGVEFSYVTIGLALVLLRIPHNDPGTLLYFLCEPNKEIERDNTEGYRQPRSAIARVLCLVLMSSLSVIRDQGWRVKARHQVNTWITNLELARSQIPDYELQQAPPNSKYTGSLGTSTEDSASEWLLSSPTPLGCTQPQPSCASSQTVYSQDQSPNDSHSKQAVPEVKGKRDFSQVTPSALDPTLRPRDSKRHRSGPDQHHTPQFCTQRCLLGLVQDDILDASCPNVGLHRNSENRERHPITAEGLLEELRQQLNRDLDENSTFWGRRRDLTSGAPFKIVCARYGYTVIGKGTTDRHWKAVSNEAGIYRILQKAQGSAVPVCLGIIDLDTAYFLHGAGQIRHMLLMAWGGEEINRLDIRIDVDREIERSTDEIRSFGVLHGDLHDGNTLWNSELQRVLIIDFAEVTLIPGLSTAQ